MARNLNTRLKVTCLLTSCFKEAKSIWKAAKMAARWLSQRRQVPPRLVTWIPSLGPTGRKEKWLSASCPLTFTFEPCHTSYPNEYISAILKFKKSFKEQLGKYRWAPWVLNFNKHTRGFEQQIHAFTLNKLIRSIYAVNPYITIYHRHILSLFCMLSVKCTQKC